MGKGPTCEELRAKLRKIGRKVTGTKYELESRLKEVLVTNDRGWETRGDPECTQIRYLASGSQRHVHLERYTKGPRKGQYCVSKRFKSGSVYESQYFKEDITANEKAAKIIAAFNSQSSLWPVYLNKPEVWHSTKASSNGKYKKFLIEPYIDGEYMKFNSNTGYADNDRSTMQSLSHFSYEHTRGELVLCDLQGKRGDGHYILTDPVICSSDGRFGATDLGQAGIDNFFAHHTCNKYCRAWRLPPRRQAYFKAVPGTTFATRGSTIPTAPKPPSPQGLSQGQLVRLQLVFPFLGA